MKNQQILLLDQGGNVRAPSTAEPHLEEPYQDLLDSLARDAVDVLSSSLTQAEAQDQLRDVFKRLLGAVGFANVTIED